MGQLPRRAALLCLCLGPRRDSDVARSFGVGSCASSAERGCVAAAVRPGLVSPASRGGRERGKGIRLLIDGDLLVLQGPRREARSLSACLVERSKERAAAGSPKSQKSEVSDADMLLEKRDGGKEARVNYQ
jgi:hypothetical protein